MARDPGRLCLLLGCLKGRPIRLASCRVVLIGVSSLAWRSEVSGMKPKPAQTFTSLLQESYDAAGLPQIIRAGACALMAPEQQSRRARSRQIASQAL